MRWKVRVLGAAHLLLLPLVIETVRMDAFSLSLSIEAGGMPAASSSSIPSCISLAIEVEDIAIVSSSLFHFSISSGIVEGGTAIALSLAVSFPSGDENFAFYVDHVLLPLIIY